PEWRARTHRSPPMEEWPVTLRAVADSVSETVVQGGAPEGGRAEETGRALSGVPCKRVLDPAGESRASASSISVGWGGIIVAGSRSSQECGNVLREGVGVVEEKA